MNTSQIARKVSFGVTDNLPEGSHNTGRPGNGGTIAPAAGLVFTGAADTGGGFFGKPVTDDSIVAFALDDSK
ncbi:MAG: hypothetical protein HYX27_08575 [Acidobacteria bacterium]|nr:hypothetical protein [Acidobacteriota bacterium]